MTGLCEIHGLGKHTGGPSRTRRARRERFGPHWGRKTHLVESCVVSVHYAQEEAKKKKNPTVYKRPDDTVFSFLLQMMSSRGRASSIYDDVFWLVYYKDVVLCAFKKQTSYSRLCLPSLVK